MRGRTTTVTNVVSVFCPLDLRLKLSSHIWSPQTIQQAVEAQAMVRILQHEEEVVSRAVVEPDSEVMSVSADGVMLHVREEGWKEVKVASISAVAAGATGVTRERHSYQASLWDAAVNGRHLWAEACRRGLAHAQRVVCVSDGRCGSGT